MYHLNKISIFDKYALFKWERIFRRIQANYVIWRAAAASVSYLTEDIRRRQLEYSTELSGRTEREPRWKECVEISSGSFSLAIGSLYVRKFFNEDAKKNALEMVNGIREEMYKILGAVEWMDDKTRYSFRLFKFYALIIIFVIISDILKEIR